MPILQYFRPDQPITLSVDASSKGISAVLLHNGHPIAYVSRALLTTQQHYAQIEKDMLAVVFGYTKFHDYIYGVPNVKVESNYTVIRKLLNLKYFT